MPVVIDCAKLDDIPALIHIYNSSIPLGYVTADTEPLSYDDFKEKIYNQHSASYPLKIAKINNEIAGWVGLKPFYGRCAYKTTAEVSIYISETMRGRGIGRFLLHFICKKGIEMGFEIFTGFIFSDNSPSIGLFEKLGFHIWGTLPKVAQIKGVRKDLVIFGKNLFHK